MTEHDDVPRMCREVRAHVPCHVSGSLPRWRYRLVGAHLRRCEGCAAELHRQREVTAVLDALTAESAEATASPPPELLDTLIGLTAEPGLRQRAAVPARGAVSGARPGLSAALLLTAAAAGTAVGYATWRAVRAVGRFRRP